MEDPHDPTAWQSADGTLRKRIDYVAVPKEWFGMIAGALMLQRSYLRTFRQGAIVRGCWGLRVLPMFYMSTLLLRLYMWGLDRLSLFMLK